MFGLGDVSQTFLHTHTAADIIYIDEFNTAETKLCSGTLISHSLSFSTIKNINTKTGMPLTHIEISIRRRLGDKIRPPVQRAEGGKDDRMIQLKGQEMTRRRGKTDGLKQKRMKVNDRVPLIT